MSYKRIFRDAAIVAIIIVIYGIYFHQGGYDFMSTSLCSLDFLPTEGIFESDPPVKSDFFLWSLSHYIFYAVLAYKYDNYILLFIIGVLWEVFESCLGKFLKNRQVDIGKFKGLTHYSEQWVIGNYSDIIFNTLGIFTGIFLKNIFKNKN